MTEIMQSIQPKWCKLIILGRKTIEVRKTRPKRETPFEVYIYCTKAKPSDVGKIPDVDCWSGKVIGEYICDHIYRAQRESRYEYIGYNAEWGNGDCLTPTQLLDYGGFNEWLYGWHISDLKIYDKPLELSDFRRPCPYTDKPCSLCKYADYSSGELECRTGIDRAPQDWCYVRRTNND